MNKPDQGSTMTQPADDRSTSERNVLLRAEHLCKSYTDGNVTAVADVNLSIRKGEYLAIIGKSGSGKSTLLNLLGA